MSRETNPGIGSIRIFRFVTLCLAVVCAALLAWGLTHVSDTPQVFGRYSWSYAGLLATLSVVLALLLVAFRSTSRRLINSGLNTYLFLGVAVLSFLAVEWGLRLINPWGVDFFHNLPYHMQGMLAHPQLGYVHPRSISYKLGQNTISLNSFGLRDTEIPIEKPVGERRIVVLGDSVTFGWGVSQGETFSDRMEPLLKSRTGVDWQVINAGVNGYNTVQEEIWFRLYGTHFRPDIVLLLYVDNDVDPIIHPNLSTWRRYPSMPSSLPEMLQRIRALSYVFQLTKLFAKAREFASARAESGTGQRSQENVTVHPGWEASFAALRSISALCDSLGIPFVVARESGFGGGFERRLSEIGIEPISFTGAWNDVPVELQYVSRVDPHPSVLVHARMAERLVDEIEHRGLLR